MTSEPVHAEVSWRKAVAHLKEAAAQDADASPMAVIHSSHYAMFHAARAVLFKATGDAPKRHDSVIQQFGLLARDLDEAMRASGRAFGCLCVARSAVPRRARLSPSEPKTAMSGSVSATSAASSRCADVPRALPRKSASTCWSTTRV